MIRAEQSCGFSLTLGLCDIDKKDIPIFWDLANNDYLMIILCLIQHANLAGLGLSWTTDDIFYIFDRNLHH